MVTHEHGYKHVENTVVVKKDSVIVSHLPRATSLVSWFFLKRGVHIISRVTGKQVHGDSLEVPCVYVYPVILQMLSTVTLQTFKLDTVHSVIAIRYLYC